MFLERVPEVAWKVCSPFLETLEDQGRTGILDLGSRFSPFCDLFHLYGLVADGNGVRMKLAGGRLRRGLGAGLLIQ